MHRTPSSSSTIIPREVLFGNPLKTSPQLSPDGKRLSYLSPKNNVPNVWVGTPGGNDFRAVTDDSHAGIKSYFWSYDSKHILYILDAHGDENYLLYSVNLDTQEIRNLTPFQGVHVSIIKQDKNFPNEIMIAMNKDNPFVLDAYRLELDTGKLTLVAINPENVSEWFVDSQFKVRGALNHTREGTMELLVRDSEEAEWVQRIVWDLDDEYSSKPIGFSQDGKSFYLVDSRQSDTGRLVKWNLLDETVELLLEDEQYEIFHLEAHAYVNSIIIHPDCYHIQAVAIGKKRKEWVILDESIRDDFAALSNLGEGDFTLCSRDAADLAWVVGFFGDKGPASYYLYDRKTKTAAFLFHESPELAKYELQPMEAVSYKTRDGLTIEGYITFPTGQREANLPMVLHVHGGPWHRVSWGMFDMDFMEMQWLANRGYICLTVNFRGSTGYGKKFVNAADKEWAGKMHDDLVDAVNWAVNKGYAIPGKIAIYGASYGGYAALVGATCTPELFCCAVDKFGPTNLLTMLRSFPPYWDYALPSFYRRVGNPDTEREFLISRSPVYKVDKIRIPIMIAMGENDPRVKTAEAEQIVAAMESRGLEYEYMLFPDEGHAFSKQETRLAFHEAAERFLAKNLGGIMVNGAAHFEGSNG